MCKVAYITQKQALSLESLEWCAGNLFAPVNDRDSTWLISENEIKGNENKSVAWVNDLQLSDYTPVHVDIPQ